MKKENNVTINTIAGLSGVSKGTVSRVLSHPEQVAPKTKEKVLSIIKQYNYQPNPVARAMTGVRKKSVSIIAPDIEFDFQSELIKSCTQELYNHGYAVFVMDNSHYHMRTTDYLDVLRQQISNGVIFCYENDDVCMRSLCNTQSVVSFEFDSPCEKIHSLTVDYTLALEDVIQYLYEFNSHRNIGLVIGRENDFLSMRISAAFSGALSKYNLPQNPEYRYFGPWMRQLGFDAIDYFRSLSSPPTALVFYTSSIAQGALMACYRYGIRVPEDLSIITLDGSQINRMLPPGITTINVDVDSIGATLANMMVGCIEGHVTHKHQRIIRPDGISSGRSVKNMSLD